MSLAVGALRFSLSSVGAVILGPVESMTIPRRLTMNNLNAQPNKWTALFAAVALTATAGLAQARDLGPDEALKLRDDLAKRRPQAEQRRTLAAHLSPIV